MKKRVINISRKFGRFKFLVVFRVFLGLGLFIKGLQFIKDKSLLNQVFKESLILQDYFWLETIIPWLSLLCGFFIIIGLYTRLSALLQIPVLAGAIIFVHAKKGIYAGESELAFSIVVLVMLLFFLFEGSGAFSLDRWMRRGDDNNFYV